MRENLMTRKYYSKETILRLKFLLDRQKQIKDELHDLKDTEDYIYSILTREPHTKTYNEELKWIFRRKVRLQQENNLINEDLVWLGNEENKPKNKRIWMA